MKPHLHHAALNVADLDWYAAFFQETFAMEVRRTSGEAPARKIWFSEGIQLNECPDAAAAGGACDHISLAVPDVPAYVAAALAAGCTPLPQGAHWLALPNGVRIELVPDA